MTCQGISLGLVSIGCCFFLSVTRRGASICSSHGESRRSRIILSRIFEFSNFFFTRNVAEVTDFLCPEFANYRIVSSHGLSRNNLFYHELSNYRISFTRNVAEGHGFFLITRLVLGPTDRREVIAEFLSITRSVADGCGACSSCEWGTIRRCL